MKTASLSPFGGVGAGAQPRRLSTTSTKFSLRTVQRANAGDSLVAISLRTTSTGISRGLAKHYSSTSIFAASRLNNSK